MSVVTIASRIRPLLPVLYDATLSLREALADLNSRGEMTSYSEQAFERALSVIAERRLSPESTALAGALALFHVLEQLGDEVLKESFASALEEAYFQAREQNSPMTPLLNTLTRTADQVLSLPNIVPEVQAVVSELNGNGMLTTVGQQKLSQLNSALADLHLSAKQLDLIVAVALFRVTQDA